MNISDTNDDFKIGKKRSKDSKSDQYPNKR